MPDPKFEAEYAEEGMVNGHLTFNELIHRLTAVVQPNPLSIGDTTPPGSPNDGDAYIIGAGATGDWATFAANDLVFFFEEQSANGGWVALTPQEGWTAHVQDTDAHWKFNGTLWQQEPLYFRRIDHVITSSPTTLDETYDIVRVNSTGGAITINLPTVASRRNEQPYVIKNTGTGANSVTIDPNGSDTIDGAATLALTDGQSVWIYAPSTGVDWLVLAKRA